MEVKKLSGKTETFDVSDFETNYKVEIPEDEIERTEDNNSFVFYRVTTREQIYGISESAYKEKIKAINEGAKFIQLGEDIININEIKHFTKKHACKNRIDIDLTTEH